VLLSETGERQAAAAAAALTAAGLRAEVVEDDERGATAVVGTAAGRGSPG
jgi:release factor glutamine methyltransferase